ncbi:MAG TPA: GNAT family N-acetyltransferase [Xanthomonadaceae bacterium]|nr:GNAT family N-acetyltransferase [Xanthomonadaceae bacterium]
MSQIAIRAAHPDDLATLVGFACAMALETEGKRLNPATVRRGIAALFAQPGRGRYLVAERSGAVAGTLMVTYEWSDWRCADWWWIQSVYVAPPHRRCGVFAALYRHLEHECAQAQGVCGLRLYVEYENQAAQRIYAGLGMRHMRYHMYEHAQPWLAQVIATGPGERRG